MQIKIITLTLLGFASAVAQPYSDRVDPATLLLSNGLIGPYLTEGLQNNPRIRAFESRYQAGRAAIEHSNALPNPRVQIGQFIESVQTRTGPQRQTIQLQQPFPPPGVLNQKRSIAQASSEALWHAYAHQQFQLIDAIAETLFEIAFLEKAISLNQENARLLLQLESLTEERVASGGELNDLVRLQIEKKRLEDTIARLERRKAESAAHLTAALGRSLPNGDHSLAWQPPEPLQSSIDDWLQALPQRNAQLAILSALERSREARLRLAKQAGRPEFNVGINYIRTGSRSDPDIVDNGKDPWALFIGVSLPIWRNANNALARESALESDAIQSEIQSLTLELIADARAQFAKLEDSQKRIQRYDTYLLPLARQSLELTEANYRTSKSSILDIIESERTIIQLETDYWRAAADAWIARWKLATLSGGLWLN